MRSLSQEICAGPFCHDFASNVACFEFSLLALSMFNIVAFQSLIFHNCIIVLHSARFHEACPILHCSSVFRFFHSLFHFYSALVMVDDKPEHVVRAHMPGAGYTLPVNPLLAEKLALEVRVHTRVVSAHACLQMKRSGRSQSLPCC